MEKAIEGYKFDRLRNRLPLVVAALFPIYTPPFILEKEDIIWRLSGRRTRAERLMDFGWRELSRLLIV